MEMGERPAYPVGCMSTTTSLKGFSPVLAAPELSPDLLPPLEMDGYLTGILVTPDLALSDWVSGLWDKGPALAQDADLKDVMTGVVARRMVIETELAKGWPGFQPSFARAGEKPDHDTVRAWARGFWKAMKLNPAYWAEVGEDERTRDLLGVFSGFIDTGTVIEERDDADEIRDEYVALMPRTLVSLRKLALMHDGNRAALQTRRVAKVGRNDPCTCGSGKKFKRCCAS